MQILDTSLKKTPIHDWHVKNGGHMVPFAGYELPIHYAPGIRVTVEEIANFGSRLSIEPPASFIMSSARRAPR